MAPLGDAFVQALADLTHEGADTAREFVKGYSDDVSKALSLFEADGQLRHGTPLPASCYNDFYKWTMLPAMLAVERTCGDVRCTFSVNIRDVQYRKLLYESAVGKAHPQLFTELKTHLSGLATRPFDRSLFERCAVGCKLPDWGPSTLDAVCGPAAEPRMLIQEFQADAGCSTPLAPSKPDSVLVHVFVAHDEKLKEDRVYIEASGPWHKVTWLETSMMQGVYDVLLRDRSRKEYGVVQPATGEWDDSAWYPTWLAASFCRCVRSVAAAVETGLKGALFTGRRTGGLALMMLQAIYTQHAFRSVEGNSLMLGTSSVTSHYMCLDAGVDPKLVPRCAGTHAHELSMVIGALLGAADDEAGMPVSQVVGHLLYFFKSLPQGDVRDASRKSLMPMLPDTLGSRAFMRVASMLTVPTGPHTGEPVLSIIGAARQDSGSLEAFKQLMDEFGFTGALMASEIEVPHDLKVAAGVGYKLFGAGGFMGDSEKAWDESKANISMAVKVLRVYLNGERCASPPVKTGETSDSGKIKEGKFEADGTLPAAELARVRERAQVLATAEPRLDAAALQALFAKKLDELLQDPEDGTRCSCHLT